MNQVRLMKMRKTQIKQEIQAEAVEKRSKILPDEAKQGTSVSERLKLQSQTRKKVMRWNCSRKYDRSLKKTRTGTGEAQCFLC